MQKINYEIDGQVVEIEVSDEFAKSYQELELEERRANEREKWRKRKKLVSLDGMVAKDVQFEDKSVDIESQYIESESKQDLYKALQKLEPQQKWLVEQVYFEGRKQSEVAEEIGIDSGSIRHRMQRIIKKLNNLLI